MGERTRLGIVSWGVGDWEGESRGWYKIGAKEEMRVVKTAMVGASRLSAVAMER